MIPQIKDYVPPIVMNPERIERDFPVGDRVSVTANISAEAPVPAWANFRQRALDVAITEINKKTDLGIKLSSIERSKHRRVVASNFIIRAQTLPKRRSGP